jgi:YD repeat-containing protein
MSDRQSRDDTINWAGATWPSPNLSEVGDRTSWTFGAATGVLLAKEYADSSRVTYDYTADGRLSKRTWARQVGGAYVQGQQRPAVC